MSWPTTSDGQWYIFDGQILMPVDPTTGAPVLLLRPQGGMGQGIPAVAQGSPGKHAQIDEAINLTELAHDDPTPASASWTILTPPTDDTPGVYKLNIALHKGEPGDDGDTVLDPSDFEGAVAGQMLVVNADLDAFELQTPKVGRLYLPESVNATPSGNPTYTLCQIPVPAQDFAWRPRVVGGAIVTGTGADVRVNLVARLNSEAGNIVATAPGIAGINPPMHNFLPLPPIGSPTGWDTIAKGASAVIYVRAERQAGNDSFTTSASTSFFGVEVAPLP